MPRPSASQIDKAFTLLEHIALAGARCPCTSGPYASNMLTSELIGALARDGRILVEIYAHNWRVVTLLTGPHKGKHTAHSPSKFAKTPYQTIDSTGARYTGGRRVSVASRNQSLALPRV